MSIIDWLSQPWPWYASGFGIALVMFLLLFFGGQFGVSANLRTICSMTGAGNNCEFFDFNWKKQIWNLMFVGGSILGGYIAAQFLQGFEIQLEQDTVAGLRAAGAPFNGTLLPDVFLFKFMTPLSLLYMIIGGFLVGFGSRYAGGCTSGHAISGLSNFQLPSLIAVIGFFIGGLLMNWLLLPILIEWL